MPSFRIWSLLLIVIAPLLASLACAGYAREAPLLTPAEAQPLATAQPSRPVPTFEPAIAPTAQPAIPENRLLVLEWPPRIKTGDAKVIRLSLVMDERGNMTPTAFVEGNQLQTEPVQVPNLYATHDVIAEVRLDMAGIEYTPSGDVAEPLRPGQPVTFLWSVRPNDAGSYQGTIWVHLRFVPFGGGPETRSVLSAQIIEIQAVNLLGLGGSAARVLGSIGTVLGSAISLDSILPWLWKLIQGRRRQETSSEK